MSEPLLSLRGVETYYGNIAALRGVDIDVNKGEIVALIGANGAGKSTLMMTICGEPRARAGLQGETRHANGHSQRPGQGAQKRPPRTPRRQIRPRDSRGAGRESRP